MRFMMSIRTREDFGTPPPALFEAMGGLIGEMSANGSLVDTGGLVPGGVELRLADGRLSVSDGPFTESKELVGGYAIMKFDSQDEAVEHARRFLGLHQQHWPGFEGAVEIRKIEEPGPPPGAA